MKKLFVLMGTALTLAACVVDPAAPVINAQLAAMHEQPVSNVFARLGYPTGESQVAGTKFYYWSNNGIVMQPTTYDTTTTTWVGKKAITSDQTTFGPDQPVPYGCMIRVFVNPDETVFNYDVRGDQTGCASFAQRLNPAYNPRAHFVR